MAMRCYSASLCKHHLNENTYFWELAFKEKHLKYSKNWHNHTGIESNYLIFLLKYNSAVCIIVKHTDNHVSLQPE